MVSIRRRWLSSPKGVSKPAVYSTIESLHGVTVRVPQGDDMGMAEACPEPVEGKTLRGAWSRSYPSHGCTKNYINFLGDTDQLPHDAFFDIRLEAVGCPKVNGAAEQFFKIILQGK